MTRWKWPGRKIDKEQPSDTTCCKLSSADNARPSAHRHMSMPTQTKFTLLFRNAQMANRTLSLGLSEDGLGPHFSSCFVNTSCRSVTHSRMLRNTTDQITETSHQVSERGSLNIRPHSPAQADRSDILTTARQPPSQGFVAHIHPLFFVILDERKQEKKKNKRRKKKNC